MRFVPIKHLNGDERLAVNITTAAQQTLVRKGTVLNQKIIDRIKKYGVQSVYVESQLDDQADDQDVVKDVIEPEVRSQSVHNIMKAIDRFQSRIIHEKKALKYGDAGQDLFEGIKGISSDLIHEIMLSKNARVMMNDIKTGSDYHYKHSVNVAVLSLIIGTEMGLNSKDLENLAFGALLLDFGINQIDKNVLYKEEKLSDEEMVLLKTHVSKGYEFLNNNTTFNAHVKSIVMHHHERMDGSGYPNGLTGDEIHPLARIVMIADVYDALTSDRPHRSAYNQHEAVEYIMAHAHNHFDFKIANIFARKIMPYPVGTYVKLSNNQQGVILKNNPQHPLRPVVRTFGKSKYDDSNAIKLDLLENNNVIIEKIIYNLS
ncbi:MAG: HD-GYP domain-containing protein [Clostridia bacterium]|nr:HD-GYP domain-containing protein [Clostridia bacterium]